VTEGTVQKPSEPVFETEDQVFEKTEVNQGGTFVGSKSGFSKDIHDLEKYSLTGRLDPFISEELEFTQ
jgi:hypothetical protein